MQLCRKHICKLIVLLWVLLGYSLHLAQPLSATRHSNDFARWLQTVVKEDHLSHVHQELEDLQSHQGDLEPLIHKASKIVRENNEDFRLPVNQNDISQADVFQLLVEKWKQYRSGEAMQPLSLPLQDSKSQTIYPRLSSVLSRAGTSIAAFTQTACAKHILTPVRLLPNPYRIDTIPLIGGTAIGAP